MLQGTGDCQVFCCGKTLKPMEPQVPDENHALSVSEIEDDFYIGFHHEMSKEHYIGFVSYVRFDRVLTVKLYPEQDAAVRIPRMFGGRILFYCKKHGLFAYTVKPCRTKG